MSSAETASVIQFEWYAESIEDEADLAEDLAALQQADPTADLELVESKGILPLLPFIFGAMGLALLAREISDLVCRRRKRGMIIDARVSPLKIHKTKDLTGGTVLVIAKDGQSSQYSVCEGKMNLSDLIEAAAHAPG